MKINKLTIRNFKGVKSLEVTPAGASVLVRGANGTGKTTIADAINWLFFGKDSAESANFGIRPINGDREAVTEVSAEIGGMEHPVSIKKTLSEKWVKPKGQIEEVYKGTETACEWNGLPVKAAEWKSKIVDLFNGADESVVKICNNPGQFFRLKWEQQRALLTSVAGTPTDEELSGQKGGEIVSEFLKELSGQSVTEYKARLKNDLKELKAKVETIPARIDELNGMKREPNPEAENKLAEVNAEIEKVKATINGSKEARADIDKQAAAVQAEINALTDQIFTEQRKAKQEAAQLTDQYAAIERELKNLNSMQENASLARASLNNQKADLIEEWEAAQELKYNGDGICPFCGQPLPADKMEEAKAKFNTEKAERIKDIEKRGAELNIKIEQAEKAYSERENEVTSKKAQLKELSDKQANLKPVDVSALEDKKNELRAQLEAIQTGANANEAINTLQELTKKADELKAAAGVFSFNADIDKRIEKLRTENLQTGAKIAELEGRQYRAAQYEKMKVEAIESRVNALFEKVRFKMFDYTIDGNPVDTCKATINGVNYQDLNTASKINSGLEIIAVFSKFYGIEAPVVIDNRESVTEIYETGLQTFNLVVAPEEKEIQVINI